MSSAVPEGWRARLFGDLAKVINGYAFKSSDFVEKSETSVPIIRMSSLKAGTIDLSDAVYVAKNNVKGLEKFLLNSGDFVFGMSGSISNFAIIKEKDGICYQNQRVGRLSPINASSGFLSQLFLSESVSRQIEGLAAGGAQLNISSSQIENLNILSPPLPEQKKIASILTSVDEVIENTQQQIDKLQDLKKATMNELLTKGIGHTEFKDSKLGRIPKSWEVKRLGEVAYFQRGHDITAAQRTDGVFPVVSSSGISGYHNESTTEAPCVVVGRKGSIGTVHFLERDFWAHDTSLFVKDFFSNHEKYVYYLCCWLDLQQYGTKSGAPSLNRNDIHPVKIKIPPFSEQKLISKVISDFELNIQKKTYKLQKTQSLKKSLMQDLLTGKVRVTVN